MSIVLNTIGELRKAIECFQDETEIATANIPDSSHPISFGIQMTYKWTKKAAYLEFSPYQ